MLTADWLLWIAAATAVFWILDEMARCVSRSGISALGYSTAAMLVRLRGGIEWRRTFLRLEELRGHGPGR